MRVTTAGLALASAVILSACNGNANSFTGQCNPPNGISTALVYPAPNSTGIPDNFGLIVLGSTSALPGNYQAYVVNDTTGNAAYFNFVGVPPSPLPAPNMLPSFANPVYQASGSPLVTWVAGSTLTVYLNEQANCAPTLNLGSFRVQ